MKTVIGLDHGTQAARAIRVDAAAGEVLCSHSVRYPHGVLEAAHRMEYKTLWQRSHALRKSIAALG